MSTDIRRYLNILTESTDLALGEAAVTSSMAAKTYYHGCSKEALALKIIETGIQPPSIEVVSGKYGSKRAKTAPVAGRVYLAQSPAYAIIYALGGDVAGHKMWDSMFERNGRYGYLFVVPGSELADIQPDEDSVGEFLSRHSERKWDQSTKPWRNLGIHFKPDGIDNVAKNQVFDFIWHAMTERQRTQAVDGMLADQAAGGKRVLKSMPDWMKVKLIEWGAHVANAGPVIPSEVWRIDKTLSEKLVKDGSNFFEIAERIR